MTSKKKMKLVLSGSGTKFPLFAGAIKRLEEEGLEFEEVIGTSGGSIIAAAVASGYDGAALIRLCLEIVPTLSKLVDFNILRPLTEFGFIKKDKIKAELAKHLIHKMGDAHIPLHITTTNFDTSSSETFTSQSHPDFEAARIISASISIPIVFVPEIINGDMYVDGGIYKNFAIDHFKDADNVVGLYFEDKKGRQPRPKGWKALFEFIGRIISMLINAKTEDDIEDVPKASHIPLHTNVSGLDFSFSQKEIKKMIEEGYNCVDKWIKENPGKLRS